MELGGCFPRGMSQTIPMSLMVPLIVPPLHHPTPNQAGTQGPFLHSCVQWVGRSWGPALALARLQGFCQQGGIGPHSFSQWVALGQALRKPKRPFWAKQIVPYTSSLVPSAHGTRQQRAKVLWPQNFPHFPKCLGGLKP